MTDYETFLASKVPIAPAVGIELGPMPDHLFDFAALWRREKTKCLWGRSGDEGKRMG